MAVPAAPYSGPRISPKGTAVLVSARLDGDRRAQIYAIDLARSVPSRLTRDASHRDAVWSPDGAELVFNSTRDGHLNLYRAPVSDPAAATRLTTSSLDQHPTNWSTDGRLVFTERLPYDESRILTMSMTAGDATPERITPEGSSELGGAPSPDGKWLAYERDGHVWVRGFSVEEAGSADMQISASGGPERWPRWHPDGGELFYASPDGNRLLVVDVDARDGFHAGREREVSIEADDIELDLFWGRFDVARDGRILVVARKARTAPMRVVVSMNRIQR